MSDPEEQEAPAPREATPRGAVVSSGVNGFIDATLGELTRDGTSPNPALNTSGGYTVTQTPAGHFKVTNPFNIGLGVFENTLEVNARIARDRLNPAGKLIGPAVIDRMFRGNIGSPAPFGNYPPRP